MKNPEIILNLWLVQDEDGIVYSLRARAYLGQGSDDKKLDLLKNFATVDYLLARVFPIPKAFYVRLGDKATELSVAYRPALDAFASPLAIFEEAIKTLNYDLPAQTNLQFPADPLVCITTLIGDENGNIRPIINSTRRLSISN